MDFVNVNPDNGPVDRTNCSGVRVLDGED
jgi:hypothetical protein